MRSCSRELRPARIKAYRGQVDNRPSVQAVEGMRICGHNFAQFFPSSARLAITWLCAEASAL